VRNGVDGGKYRETQKRIERNSGSIRDTDINKFSLFKRNSAEGKRRWRKRERERGREAAREREREREREMR